VTNLTEEQLNEILKKEGYSLEPVKLRKRVTKARGRGARRRPIADSKRSVNIMGTFTHDYALTVLEPAVERREIIGWKFINAYVANIPVHFFVYFTDGRLRAVTVDNEIVDNVMAPDMGMLAEFWNGDRVEYFNVRYKTNGHSFTICDQKPEMEGHIFVGELLGSRSATETYFHNRLEAQLSDGSIECFVYEPCPIRYPGITYTPDYAAWEIARTVFYEVKSGQDVMHSKRSSSIMMRVMGGMFASEDVHFLFATYNSGEWKVTPPRMMGKIKRHPQME
jgi:hypothetical protein